MKFFIGLGNAIRWFLTLAIVWGLVLPETGPWTCFCLTMIAIGIEFEFATRKPRL